MTATTFFGAPDGSLSVEALNDPETVFQVGVPPNRIDVLTALSGVDFEHAWATRVAAHYGDIPIAYLGLDALLDAKRASGRPQDLLDVAELQRVHHRQP
ncbi:MAG: hypothetical protein HZB39_02255 [Planctomycetes bacterium]|nr:hypothetical protein [Planctomycetota bacterium]